MMHKVRTTNMCLMFFLVWLNHKITVSAAEQWDKTYMRCEDKPTADHEKCKNGGQLVGDPNSDDGCICDCNPRVIDCTKLICLEGDALPYFKFPERECVCANGADVLMGGRILSPDKHKDLHWTYIMNTGYSGEFCENPEIQYTSYNDPAAAHGCVVMSVLTKLIVYALKKADFGKFSENGVSGNCLYGSDRKGNLDWDVECLVKGTSDWSGNKGQNRVTIRVPGLDSGEDIEAAYNLTTGNDPLKDSRINLLMLNQVLRSDHDACLGDKCCEVLSTCKDFRHGAVYYFKIPAGTVLNTIDWRVPEAYDMSIQLSHFFPRDVWIPFGEGTLPTNPSEITYNIGRTSKKSAGASLGACAAELTTKILNKITFQDAPTYSCFAYDFECEACNQAKKEFISYAIDTEWLPGTHTWTAPTINSKVIDGVAHLASKSARLAQYAKPAASMYGQVDMAFTVGVFAAMAIVNTMTFKEGPFSSRECVSSCKVPFINKNIKQEGDECVLASGNGMDFRLNEDMYDQWKKNKWPSYFSFDTRPSWNDWPCFNPPVPGHFFKGQNTGYNEDGEEVVCTGLDNNCVCIGNEWQGRGVIVESLDTLNIGFFEITLSECRHDFVMSKGTCESALGFNRPLGCPDGKHISTCSNSNRNGYECKEQFDGNEPCVNCPNGFGRNQLQAFEAGYNNNCLSCPPGKGRATSGANGKVCATCAPGKFSTGKGCYDCPAGWFQLDTPHTKILTGYEYIVYSDGSYRREEVFESNEHHFRKAYESALFDVAATFCTIRCPSGWKSTGGCEICPIGYAQKPYTDLRSIYGNSYYDKDREYSDIYECVKCDNGYYQDEAGQFRCKTCGGNPTYSARADIVKTMYNQGDDEYKKSVTRPEADWAEIKQDFNDIKERYNYDESWDELRKFWIQNVKYTRGDRAGERFCPENYWCPAGEYLVAEYAIAYDKDGNKKRGLYEMGSECKKCEQNEEGGLYYYQDEEGGYGSCKRCISHSVAPKPEDGATKCPECLLNFANKEYYNATYPNQCKYCPRGWQVSDDNSCEKCPEGTWQGYIHCNDCPAGRFNPYSGQYSYELASNETENENICKTCPAGFYSANRAAECTACPAGYWDDPQDAEFCHECAAGKYTAHTGSSSCINCEPGFYSAIAASSICSQCPAGYWNDLEGSKHCKMCVGCPQGQGYAYCGDEFPAVCEACPKGFYNDNNPGTCKYCPRGKYNLNTGSSDEDDCLWCPLGYTSVVSRDKCCLHGERCVECPAGWHFDTSLVQGVRYQYNFFCSGKIESDCKSHKLIRGTYVDGKFVKNVIEDYCEYIADEGLCVERKESYSVTETIQICGLCLVRENFREPGTYISKDYSAKNSEECAEECPEHTYKTTEAYTLPSPVGTLTLGKCEPCVDSTRLNGETECTKSSCHYGKYPELSTGGQICRDCPVGWHSDDYAICKECPDGKYQEIPGSYACSDHCSAGKRFDLVHVGNFECNGDQTKPWEDKSKLAISQEDAFIECANECFIRDDPTHGFIFGVNYFVYSCWCEKQASTCSSKTTTWSADNVWTGTWNYHRYDYGQFYWQYWGVVCKECPLGYIPKKSDIGLNMVFSCEKCAEGRYQDEQYKNTCKQCPNGQNSSPDGSSCQVCPLSYNMYKNCLHCPAGWKSGTGAANCEKCLGGTYRSVDDVSCSLCAAGKFSIAGTECQDCPAGWRDTVTRTNCETCPEGTYRFTHNDDCVSCPRGTKIKSADVVRSEYYVMTLTGDTGQYYQVCADCPHGWGSNSQSTDCVQCLMGEYSNDGPCNKCPSGWYANSEGQRDCHVCDNGYTPNSHSCFSCPDDEFVATESGGPYHLGGEKICRKCPAGYEKSFSFKTGQYVCKSCTDKYSDRYYSEEGKVCQECPENHALVGTTCEECETGKYLSDNQCKNCEPGFYSAIAASSVCSQCPEGRFEPNVRSSYCRECDIGKYQDTKGKDKCKQCPEGYITNDDYTACLQCPSGYHVWYDNQCRRCQSVRQDGECCGENDFDTIGNCEGSCTVSNIDINACSNEIYSRQDADTFSLLKRASLKIIKTPDQTELQYRKARSLKTATSLFHEDVKNAKFEDYRRENNLAPEPDILKYQYYVEFGPDNSDGQNDCSTVQEETCYTSILDNKVKLHLGCDDCWQVAADGKQSPPSPVVKFEKNSDGINISCWDNGWTIPESKSIGEYFVCTNYPFLAADESIIFIGCDQDDQGNCEDKDRDGFLNQKEIDCGADPENYYITPYIPHAEDGICECFNGMHNDTDDHTCKPWRICTNGTREHQRPTSISDRVCEKCPKGKFSSKVDTNNIHCEYADAGYYVPASGATEQIKCPEKTYQQFRGQEKCDICPHGKQASTDLVSCENCPKGTYGESGICIDCPNGFFNDIAGNQHCPTCPTGSFDEAPEDGAISCTRCPAGFYDDDLDVSTACIECQADYEIHRDFPHWRNDEYMYVNSNGDWRSCIKSHWKPSRCANVQYDQEGNYLFDWIPGPNDCNTCDQLSSINNEEDCKTWNDQYGDWSVTWLDENCAIDSKLGQSECVEDKCRVFGENDSGGRYCSKKDPTCGEGTKEENSKCVLADDVECQQLKDAHSPCSCRWHLQSLDVNTGNKCGPGTKRTSHECIVSSNGGSHRDCLALKIKYKEMCCKK